MSEKQGGDLEFRRSPESPGSPGAKPSDSVEVIGHPSRPAEVPPSQDAPQKAGSETPTDDGLRVFQPRNGAAGVPPVAAAPATELGHSPAARAGSAAAEGAAPPPAPPANGVPRWTLPVAPPANGGPGRYAPPPARPSGSGTPGAPVPPHPAAPGPAPPPPAGTTGYRPLAAPVNPAVAGSPGTAPPASAPGYRPAPLPGPSITPGINGAVRMNGRPPATPMQPPAGTSSAARQPIPPALNGAPPAANGTPPANGTHPANGTSPTSRPAEGAGGWRPLPGPALVSPQRPTPSRVAGRLASLAPDPEPVTTRPAPAPPSTARDLAPELVRPSRIPPATRGWRRTVRAITFGAVHPSPGRAERRERGLIVAARVPIATCRRVAIVSRKGGIGKTTTTLMLGHTFALHRGDRVVALDANPDAGSLAYRVHRDTDATVTQLLRAADRIRRYSDMRSFTSQSSTRLEVLASDDDPTISVALGEAEYREVLDVLEHHYNLILMDTGTGILDSATQGILRMADQIVVCAAPGIDASRASSLTLDWLDEHGYHDLVSDAVVVINQVRKDGGRELRSVSEHFAKRCRAVVKVPWDPHLAEGLAVDVDKLRPRTRDAYLAACAAVARSFSLPSRRR